MPAAARTVPLLLTGLVALAALALAAWMVFGLEPKTVEDEPTLPTPQAPAPAPMPTPKPATPATP